MKNDASHKNETASGVFYIYGLVGSKKMPVPCWSGLSEVILLKKASDLFLKELFIHSRLMFL